MTNKLTIAFTRREADLYRSHGLLEEARQLYRQVMDEAGTLGPGLTASLKEKINQLEAELAELDVDLSEVVSERELCILREGWGDAQSPVDIRTCASALGSIGLYEAAIEEYGRLVRLNQSLADYIEGLTDCIVAVYTPEAIPAAVESIAERNLAPEAHPTGLRIAMALELAKRDIVPPALALFASARAIRPLPVKVETFVEELQKRRQAKGDTAGDDGAPPASQQTAAYQLKIRLANRLARLRGLMRRLRKA
jgi:hypothetical protein